MKTISTLEELDAVYDAPLPNSIHKVMTQLTPLYREWIETSRFVILSTVGPDGTDASPRGDIGPVVRIATDKTLHLPDWRGNNRLDSLRNIILDGRVSLMFMVPGCKNVVRVNGTAVLADDPDLTGSFQTKGISPKSVIVITIEELYFQCAKALMRSALWDSQETPSRVPTAGDFIREFNNGFDGKAYDDGYGTYAKDRMW